jgi:O-glycosyl hydrolase
MTNSHSCFISFLLFGIGQAFFANAQPEVMAWGNLTGIRVEGQLMEFESSVRVVTKGWMFVDATGQERQQPKYMREGQKQVVTSSIGGIRFSETIEDSGPGCAVISFEASAEQDTVVEGLFFCVDLPSRYYHNAGIRFMSGSPAGRSRLNLLDISPENNFRPFQIAAKGLAVTSLQRQIEISWDSKLPVFIRKETGSDVQVYVLLMGPEVNEGLKTKKTFTIKASGIIDHAPAEIILDTRNPGRRFDGLGGNFRLQNPRTDPQVIQYCLNKLRVAWGRVEMPWNLWHPDESVNPVEAAGSGNLNSRVQAAMKMAQRLDSIGIPVIVSVWSAPAWAILGDPADAYRLRSKGIYGYPLNPEKMEEIYQSIGDYLVYLKRFYGVEAALFSFNESDLGINIRQTGQEHAEFIKGFGRYLASRGLSTKLMLGDNSDATTFDFIMPAMEDHETHKYIGAVSFHSWRGCTNEKLREWAEAAEKLNLPLIVAEGSTDAAAWKYPEIFSEQSFALHEINLYIRICALCQPVSILQWQLTADYSVLKGNGIFGREGPLSPTQRFWNLKQLASTPEDAFAIPVSCNKEGISCAAFGNISRGAYAVHIVNNRAECRADVKGIPPHIHSLEIYVTDQTKGMEKAGEIRVIDGTAEFTLLPASFTTLVGRSE